MEIYDVVFRHPEFKVLMTDTGRYFLDVKCGLMRSSNNRMTEITKEEAGKLIEEKRAGKLNNGTTKPVKMIHWKQLQMAAELVARKENAKLRRKVKPEHFGFGSGDFVEREARAFPNLINQGEAEK